MDVLRILHVIHSANPKGGGPIEGIKQLARALVSEFPDTMVDVVCLDAPSDPWIAGFPLTIYSVGPGFSKYGWTPKLLPWLKRHCPDYDVIIVNGLWQFPGFAVWRTLHHSTTPYCVFTHGMLDPWFKRRYPLKHLKKWLYWLLGEYWVLRRAAKVFFTAEEERLQAHESFSLYRAREAVVSYGTAGSTGSTPTQRTLFLERFPELRDKRVLLFLGRVHEKKGCDLLLHAFHRLLHEPPGSDLWLAMVGPSDHEYGMQLKQLALQLGIADRVVWTGMLEGALKWGAFHSAEAFILPSHQENFGIAVAEALACGLPVLISDKVNIWREIDHDKAGFVESDDLSGAIRLLQRWEALDVGEREAMRGRALECFSSRFEIAKAARSLHEELVKVVEARAGKRVRSAR